MTDRRRHDSESAIGRWDRVFKALAAEPRRQLVAALADAPADGAVPLPEAAMNPDVRSDPERADLELRHRHLPLLADADYVEWRSAPFRASRGARFAEVRTVFDGVAANAATLPEQLRSEYQLLERERSESDGPLVE